MTIVLYFRAVLKHWWALMSCAAFTILGLYIAWANKGNDWTARGIFILAGVFLLVASFLAWRDEHIALQAEITGNAYPDIRGEVFVAFRETPRNPFDDRPVLSNSRYYLHMRLVNRVDAPCTVDKYQLVFETDAGRKISEVGSPLVSGNFEHGCSYIGSTTTVDPIWDSKTKLWPMAIDADHPLTRGRAQEGWVGFLVRDYVPKGIEQGCWQEIFTLVVTDSFGRGHEIVGPLITACNGTFKMEDYSYDNSSGATPPL